MRKLFMTDIHGDHKGMMSLLERAKFHPEKDQLIFGGDFIDRGIDSGLVIKEAKSLSEKYPEQIKAVTGNHELMASWFYYHQFPKWFEHGGQEALDSFNKEFQSKEEFIEHLKWLFQLPVYVEDDQFVYCHAGFNFNQPIDEQEWQVLFTDKNDFYSVSPEEVLAYTGGKPIIHGHTPCQEIYFDGVRMDCDLGSNAYPHIEIPGLALVDLDNMMYWLYLQDDNRIIERKIGLTVVHK